MVALPSLRICLRLALYMGSLYGDVMWLMLLAPLATPAVAFSATETRVFVPPTFHSCVLLAAGLFRVDTIRLLCR
jgi:hypothetical protein